MARWVLCCCVGMRVGMVGVVGALLLCGDGAVWVLCCRVGMVGMR